MIFLDGHPIPLQLSPDVSLAVVISILERGLVKQNRRITSILSGGEDVFNPEEFPRPWFSFGQIDCQSGQIPKDLKKAVVTLTMGEVFCEMARVSHPLMRLYADKVGADFIVIDKIKVNMPPVVLFEKWQMYAILFKYDRIIFLDTDVLVSLNCPDLFDIVKLDKIGGFNESDYVDCGSSITGIQAFLGEIGWRKEYLNSGVGVYSYIHKPLFERPQRYMTDHFAEQNMYNYRIKKLGFQVHCLPIKFNCMEYDGDENRLSNFITHYAGWAWTGICQEDIAKGVKLYPVKIALMKKDSEELIR